MSNRYAARMVYELLQRNRGGGTTTLLAQGVATWMGTRPFFVTAAQHMLDALPPGQRGQVYTCGLPLAIRSLQTEGVLGRTPRPVVIDTPVIFDLCERVFELEQEVLLTRKRLDTVQERLDRANQAIVTHERVQADLQYVNRAYANELNRCRGLAAKYHMAVARAYHLIKPLRVRGPFKNTQLKLISILKEALK